jgi:NAD(P)-dependent dehydrogenase (short-subunit alcohol dehydrogenase family)
MIFVPPATPDYSSRQDLLKDRVIVVTGAGQGLGQAAALAFAAQGAVVVLSGRSQRKLEKTYDAILAAGGAEPAMLPFDLATQDESQFQGFAQTLHSTFGRLDGLFHAASHFVALCPAALQTMDHWQQMAQVNLIAPFALTKACLPMLKRAPQASVVFIAESHVLEPKAFWGGFTATQAGLPALTQTWAPELQDTPVRIHCLVPGPLNSPQRRQTHPGELPAALPQLAAMSPWCQWLMGPDAGEANGKLISLEGRLPAGPQ